MENNKSYLEDKNAFVRKLDHSIKKYLILFLVLAMIITSYFVYIQVFKSEYYQNKLIEVSEILQEINSPRGMIFDRNNRILVGNSQNISLSYFYDFDMSDQDVEDLATKLIADFDIMDKFILDYRQIRDMWIDARYKDGTILYEIGKRLGENYLSDFKSNKISESLMRKDLVPLIKDEEITFTILEKAHYKLVQLLKAAKDGRMHIILDNLEIEMANKILLQKQDYPGFNIFIDWQREYPQGNLLKSILGKITNGLPREESAYLLNLSYNLTDPIGISGLEKYYEDYLRGKKSTYKINYDQNNNQHNLEYKSKGYKGYGIALTIDSEFNQEVDQILIDYFKQEKDNKYRPDFNQLQVVVMNPKNGDILAMSGIYFDREKLEFRENASANYLSGLQVGSSIKGIISFMGLNEGVIDENTIILDAPMKFRGTPVKGSYSNYGLINLKKALEVSSNVYMFHVVLRLSGLEYKENMYLNISPQIMDKIRNYYQLFGMGIPTGLDVSHEETGYKGISFQSGHILDNAIGYFDTFTTMQLATYASTLANGGYRVKPHFLKSVLNYNSNSIFYNYNPEILNRIEDHDNNLAKVKDGFLACASSGRCGVGIKNSPYRIAAKTGTADVLNDNVNNTEISFAPYEDPQVVVACAAINSSKIEKLQTNPCMSISAEIYNKYFTRYPIAEK